MISKLSQNRLFIERKIIIEDTKLLYYSSKFGNVLEIGIPYEDLTTFKETYRIRFQQIWLIVAILTFFSVVLFSARNDKDQDPYMWMYSTFLLIGIIVFHFLYKEKVWRIKLQNYSYIFINKKLPNAKEVDIFIDNIFIQRNKHLKETYFHISKNMPYESQLKNLQWLKKSEAIDVKEFDEMRQKLDVLFNSDKKIGF